MKIIRFFTISSILAFVVLVLVTFYQLTFWSWLNDYHQANQQYQTYCQSIDCVSQTGNLYDYLILSQEIDQGYYSSKEINHLKDIKLLIFQAVVFLSLICLLLILVFWRLIKKNDIKNRQLGLMMFVAGDLLVFFGLFCYLFFDFLFLQFHLLAFNDDFWLLDPKYESLIIIFPPELFLFLAIEIIGISVAFLWLGALLFILKSSKN
jgi:integral membrane protein (TIGR01906 family)